MATPRGIQKIFVTQLTAVDSVAKEPLGTIRFDGNKIYKYVELANITATVAGVAGSIASYSADLYDVNKVVLDADDADTKPIGAGVLQATVVGVLAVSEFCWIQIKGGATLNVVPVAGSAVDGDAFVADAAVDKGATRLDYAGTTPAILENAARMGQVQDASTGQVILDCPF